MSFRFSLIPYRKEHVMPLLDQPINRDSRADFIGGLAEWAEKQNSFTGIINDVPVVCGGVLEYWPGRAQIWTIFNAESKENFVPVFRGIKRFLAEQGKTFRRLEISVPCNFELGRRRAELLGFKLECGFAEAFLPDGTDCALYSLVRKGG